MKRMREKPIRILIAKPGLDGHDRGAKVIAHALRDRGLEVIYTGLHKTIDEIVETSVQEDVRVIGLSILSGAHIPILKKLMDRLKELNIADKVVIVGGNIPRKDIENLKKIGAAEVFPTGSKFDDIADFIKKAL